MIMEAETIGPAPQLRREWVRQPQRQRRLVRQDDARSRGEGPRIQRRRFIARCRVHHDDRALVNKEGDGFSGLDELSPGRNLAQCMARAAGMNERLQQVVR